MSEWEKLADRDWVTRRQVTLWTFSVVVFVVKGSIVITLIYLKIWLLYPSRGEINKTWLTLKARGVRLLEVIISLFLGVWKGRSSFIFNRLLPPEILLLFGVRDGGLVRNKSGIAESQIQSGKRTKNHWDFKATMLGGIWDFTAKLLARRNDV